MEITVKNLLKTALAPIGKTLYIYGGGWDEADTGAGLEAKSLGLSPRWQEFYAQNASPDYNFKDFDYKKDPTLIHKGLDCSAYVGWVLYNIFETKYSKTGYVYKSTETAKTLAEMGLGEYTSAGEFTDFAPADILSGEKTEHVYIAVGKCQDGSLLLLHSSPPAPMMTGTLDKTGGKTEAAALAEEFMQKRFPNHFKTFPQTSRPYSYQTDFGRFRFYKHILADPENLRSLSPKEILKIL